MFSKPGLPILGFEDTIVAQFYGHTHREEVRLFYTDDEPKRVTNVAFISGGATTYPKFNPSYKIFMVDGNTVNPTWQIYDHETWIYNLTSANELNHQPYWFKLRGRTDLQVNGFRPEDAKLIVQNLLHNDEILTKYHSNHIKNSDEFPLEECDLLCKKSLLCNMMITDVTDMQQCKDILNQIDRIEEEKSKNKIEDIISEQKRSAAATVLFAHYLLLFAVFLFVIWK